MSAPWVGPETDEHRAVCVYAPTPDHPKCDHPATTHIMVRARQYGPVSLASCDAHRPIALASGEPIDEHPYRGWCGLPGTLWHQPTGMCVIDGSGSPHAAHEVTCAGPAVSCVTCGDTGLSGPGAGYGDVCSDCGGQSAYREACR